MSRGRPKNKLNRKYFVQLKELNTLFGPDAYIPVTKDFGLTVGGINPTIVITDSKEPIKPIKVEDKIEFEVK